MSTQAKDELILFTGNSNPALASAVARDLGVQLGAAEVRTFSDGEILVEIDENVRGGDVFVLQSIRSEERRVGKECRSRWSPYH